MNWKDEERQVYLYWDNMFKLCSTILLPVKDQFKNLLGNYCQLIQQQFPVSVYRTLVEEGVKFL